MKLVACMLLVCLPTLLLLLRHLVVTVGGWMVIEPVLVWRQLAQKGLHLCCLQANALLHAPAHVPILQSAPLVHLVA